MPCILLQTEANAYRERQQVLEKGEIVGAGQRVYRDEVDDEIMGVDFKDWRSCTLGGGAIDVAAKGRALEPLEPQLLHRSRCRRCHLVRGSSGGSTARWGAL